MKPTSSFCDLFKIRHYRRHVDLHRFDFVKSGNFGEFKTVKAVFIFSPSMWRKRNISTSGQKLNETLLFLFVFQRTCTNLAEPAPTLCAYCIHLAWFWGCWHLAKALYCRVNISKLHLRYFGEIFFWGWVPLKMPGLNTASIHPPPKWRLMSIVQ